MGISLYFGLAWFDVDSLRKKNIYKGLNNETGFNFCFIFLDYVCSAKSTNNS
jgi:hypothetical protein